VKRKTELLCLVGFVCLFVFSFLFFFSLKINIETEVKKLTNKLFKHIKMILLALIENLVIFMLPGMAMLKR